MKRLVLFLAIAAVTVSGGCIAQVCPTGLLTGVLTEQAGELVVTPSIGRPVRVNWPDGHAVRQDADTLVLVNVVGVVVAREGDTVRLGGGQAQDQPDAWQVCGLLEVTR